MSVQPNEQEGVLEGVPLPWSPEFSVKTASPADLFLHLLQKYASLGDSACSKEKIEELTREYFEGLVGRYLAKDVADAAFIASGMLIAHLASLKPDSVRDDQYERRLALMCGMMMRELAPKTTLTARKVAKNKNEEHQ